MSGTNNSGDWNSGYRNSGNWNSGNGNSGYRNSGYRNSGDGNSGYRNSGDGNSGYRNSGTNNSGDWNSGYRNSGNWNSGNWNSGNGNSGDGNSGYRNSGDRNSGCFNTDEPKARMFNRECGSTFSELRDTGRIPTDVLPVTAWVAPNAMTDEEKREYPDWETVGGYLKTLGYKDAWAVMWAGLSDEQKQKYLELPNFDAGIFAEITGIDVTAGVPSDESAAIALLESRGRIVDGI